VSFDYPDAVAAMTAAVSAAGEGSVRRDFNRKTLD
jgi:hypothetical protein